MASSKKSTEVLSVNHQDNGEWLETTPGERFTIRTSAKETKGIYTMLEVVADPRNGVPMHVHKNEFGRRPMFRLSAVFGGITC
jgi:hypothetical protein